jgi:hypothetical protein
MSFRDKRHCLEIFWKWRWCCIHRRWCQENMSNSTITRTHRLWIIHFAIKRRRDNVKKKNRKCKWGYHMKWNCDIWPTSKCNARDIFLRRPRMYYFFLNLFCKQKNRRLEFNDTVFLSFVSIERRWGMPTREVDWWRPCIVC